MIIHERLARSRCAPTPSRESATTDPPHGGGESRLPLALVIAGLLTALTGCGADRVAGSDVRAVAPSASAAFDLTSQAVTPFGSFNGVRYLRYSGRFEGTTSLGAFRVPYEIIAPEIPSRGNGVVLVEPPHFSFGPIGRETVLGRELLFGRGFSYAAVGFGVNGLNILDPSATDAVIAGAPVADPGAIQFGVPPDEEIVISFVRALRAEPFAAEALGPIEAIYAYGASQTAGALIEALHAPGGQGLLDLTLLHVAMWRPPFAAGEFERSEGEFAPLSDVGRMVFVASEGDQIVSDAEQFRRAAFLPDYRVYEVAGSAHLPTPDNPLDHAAVLRAIFVAADRWVREDVAPPASVLLEEALPGAPDPVYGFVTGIARDADGNARGGVRLPDLHVGRAQFIAVDLSVPGVPTTGTSVDLACAPALDAPGDAPRFRSHGDYVASFVRQVNHLRRARFLLPEDASVLRRSAAASDVGARGSCDG
jgi:hypothetical protein